MSTGIRLERDVSLAPTAPTARVATITLDGPPLHVLDLAAIAALDAALGELEADAETQLVVLRSSGGKAFCAGVAVEDHTPEKLPAMLLGFHGAITRLRNLPAASIAVVDGHCLGGGMELALACDFVLATERSRFGQPEVQLGCYPPVAAALYPSRLGHARTLEMLLTGRTYTSEEAERLGLVTWRIDGERLAERLAELVATFTRGSRPVARLIKRAVLAGGDRPFPLALAEAERLYLEELVATADMQEGLAAFLAKRAPVWQHR